MSEEVEKWDGLIPYEDYKKLMKDYCELLAKYNGVFEWVSAHNMVYTADDIKKEYEEDLSEIQASKKE